MLVQRIYDEDLSQAAWLIGCQTTGEALIIDPERDVCRYLEAAEKEGLKITAITETHIHADFLSGTAELAAATNATCYLSKCGGPDWLYSWPDRSNADVVFVGDGEEIQVGSIRVKVFHTPGHTPEHLSFVVYDAGRSEPIGIATGDFIFVGDLGRPDLLETAAGVKGAMQNSARVLYKTCQRLQDLPDYIQVWPAHGAGSACGKALGAVPQSTLGYEKRTSPPLQLLEHEESFIEFMLTGQPEPPLYFARMKRMNRDGCPLLGGLPKPEKITDSQALREKALHAVVIDTRGWELVRDGHLPNTIWSKPTNDFHRFAGSFVEDTEDILLVVTEEELDRTLRNAVRIGLERIIGWVEPSLLEGMDGLETLQELSASQLREQEEYSVLDVRRKLEFQDGAIDGALNIAHTRLMEQIDQLDPEREWVLNCHGGSRSAAACMALKRKGFHVTNLAGGYKGWIADRGTCVASS
ncbi:MAG: MBL fold metallo-hydrolase [Phycisphaerales bacterium]|jgi:hydroxyacylglutathione hydrolase|nr:MBL fold metallo-hydrolase [Phycisphaerales bacterium]